MADIIDNDNRPAPGFEQEDGENLFLANILKHLPSDAQKEPSKEDKETKRTPPPKGIEAEEAEEEPEDSEDSQEGTSDEETEEESTEPEKEYIEDITSKHVRIKVGDDEYEVPVKDLTRLYGQEKAITQRSQQFAEDRKKLNEAAVAHVASTDALLKAAKQRYEPYSKLDFLALSRDPKVNQQQFAALREEAQHRWEEVNFLETQIGGYMQALRERQQADMNAAAVASVKDIMDPLSVNYIEGWNQDVYQELRSFAVKSGIAQAQVDNIVEAPVIKLLHDAMQFRKGKDIANTKVTRIGKSPKKVIKTKTGNTPTNIAGARNSGNKDKAIASLRKSGSVEDAANAFFASFNISED